MFKIIILYSNKVWHKNIMDIMLRYSKNVVIIFEDDIAKDEFNKLIEEYNTRRREDGVLLIPTKYDSFVIPTDGSLLHRRLRSLNMVLAGLTLKGTDRIMFLDEDDNIYFDVNAMNMYMKDISHNIIYQLSRLDYKNVMPDTIFKNWNSINDNQWEHYTVHPTDLKESILYSYNYNFTGKLFSIRVIREWLDKEYDNLMKIGPLMQQEDLIMMISLINSRETIYDNLKLSSTWKYGIYKYNYISKYRQDPSKNPIITSFIDRNINKEKWGIDAKEFPYKNLYINYDPDSGLNSGYNKRCCYLKLSYDYPWESGIFSSSYTVVYNRRFYDESKMYKVLIEKANKYGLEIKLED